MTWPPGAVDRHPSPVDCFRRNYRSLSVRHATDPLTRRMTNHFVHAARSGSMIWQSRETARTCCIRLLVASDRKPFMTRRTMKSERIECPDGIYREADDREVGRFYLFVSSTIQLIAAVAILNVGPAAERSEWPLILPAILHVVVTVIQIAGRSPARHVLISNSSFTLVFVGSLCYDSRVRHSPSDAQLAIGFSLNAIFIWFSSAIIWALALGFRAALYIRDFGENAA